MKKDQYEINSGGSYGSRIDQMKDWLNVLTRVIHKEFRWRKKGTWNASRMI